MRKPRLLRQFLCNAIPALETESQRLTMHVEHGHIVARSSDSLSFEYRFTARLILPGFASDLDLIIIPLLAWLHTHQPDLSQNKDRAATGLRFEAATTDSGTIDLTVEIDLTESVAVTQDTTDDGRQRLTAQHLGEPYSPAPYATGDYTLYLGDRIGAEWHVTPSID